MKNVYDSKGNLTDVTDESGILKIWTRISKNALGQYTGYKMGDTKTTTKGFDNYGYPTTFGAMGVYNLQMDFNAATGNLTSRIDNMFNITETFVYDNGSADTKLNRLTSSQVINSKGVNSPAITIGYKDNGNIDNKSDAGTYAYELPQINAVSSISPNATSVIPLIPQTIMYNAFNKVQTAIENNLKLTITYGVNDQRVMQEIQAIGGTATERKYYLPNYEQTKNLSNNTTVEVNYINSPDGVCAMYVLSPTGLPTLAETQN